VAVIIYVCSVYFTFILSMNFGIVVEESAKPAVDGGNNASGTLQFFWYMLTLKL